MGLFSFSFLFFDYQSGTRLCPLISLGFFFPPAVSMTGLAFSSLYSILHGRIGWARLSSFLHFFSLFPSASYRGDVASYRVNLYLCAHRVVCACMIFTGLIAPFLLFFLSVFFSGRSVLDCFVVVHFKRCWLFLLFFII